MSFQDIKVVGVDKSKTYRPDPEKLLYNVYFKLSSEPPIEWVRIFEAERRFPRHTMWRRAWVDGQYVVIHCALDEVKKYHAHDIKQDVANTNKKYGEYLRQLVIEQKKERERKGEELEKIDEALEGLDFE